LDSQKHNEVDDNSGDSHRVIEDVALWQNLGVRQRINSGANVMVGLLFPGQESEST